MRVSTSKLTYVVFHMSLLQVAWGLTLVAKNITSSEFTYMCFYNKVAWGHFSGPEVRGPTLHQVAKKHLITSSCSHTCASTCLCYKVAWGHSVRGPKVGARLLWHRYAKKHLITSFRIHIHVLLRTCLCYKVAWGHPVRGLKFGARLLWHRYGIRTRWIETHVCPLLLLWDEARNPII